MALLDFAATARPMHYIASMQMARSESGDDAIIAARLSQARQRRHNKSISWPRKEVEWL